MKLIYNTYLCSESKPSAIVGVPSILFYDDILRESQTSSFYDTIQCNCTTPARSSLVAVRPVDTREH